MLAFSVDVSTFIACCALIGSPVNRDRRAHYSSYLGTGEL